MTEVYRGSGMEMNGHPTIVWYVDSILTVNVKRDFISRNAACIALGTASCLLYNYGLSICARFKEDKRTSGGILQGDLRETTTTDYPH